MAEGQLQKHQLGTPNSATMIEAVRYRRLLGVADMNEVSFELFEFVCRGVGGAHFFNDTVYDPKVFLLSALEGFIECAAPPEGHPWFDPSQPPDERMAMLAMLERLSGLGDLQSASLFEAAKEVYGIQGDHHIERRRIAYQRMLDGHLDFPAWCRGR